jgi:hypothetical protein
MVEPLEASGSVTLSAEASDEQRRSTTKNQGRAMVWGAKRANVITPAAMMLPT